MALSLISSLGPNPPFMACPFLAKWFWTSTFTSLSLIIILYLFLVRALRYKRRDGTPSKYGYTTRESYAKMTPDEATFILRDLAQLELPRIYSSSIFFALFKTYAIPSISSLLLQTKQLSTPGPTQTKRTADTAVLLTEIIFNPPSSPRHIEAVARLNFLHDRYRSAGKVSDGDMLYTLSLFALEPVRWTGRLDWRGLTCLEKCATGVFFRELAWEMGIPAPPELTYGQGKEQDGLVWLTLLAGWSQKYEMENMVFSESNQELAERTLDLALVSVPAWLKPFMRGMVAVLLGERLRGDMGIPPPSKFQEKVFSTFINLRKFILRNFCLPRRESQRVRYFTDAADPVTGRFHALRYRVHPWYVKPASGSRWGLLALKTRFLRRGVPPGDKGDKYKPEGYCLDEVGPFGLESLGKEEMEMTKERLRKRQREWKRKEKEEVALWPSS